MNSKKIIKPAFSILIALSVAFTSNVVYASELDNTNGFKDSEYVSIGEKLESLLPEKKEEVKEITNIEELDTTVLNNDSDSAFKSCRLIIYSAKDMEFKDIKGRNNIKKVQKLDKMYIVEYASAKDTEDAYNFYTSLGVEVEIDVVNNTPEGVENKDNENQDVRNEEIASTNETKPTETVDRVKEENKNIVVAVLDSGLNNGDEIFNDKLVEGKNFVACHHSEGMTTKDENSNKTDDVYGHGTTMARVVLDTTNSSNIKIMPIKVLNDEGKGTTLSAYKGIKYAIEKNVDVINLSMSGIGHSKLLESAINEAVNLGIPVVVSAGNDNKEITEYTPANIESAITVSSAYENVLEDGKVEYLKSFYSNYGSDTNNIDFATNGHFEYKRNINDKEVTTKVEGTSVSAAYVTSFIAMLKAMALTDEDANNDKLSFNDAYASLSESAIKQEDTKIFGNGFLKKDNFKLVRSDKEEEILPIENVDNVTENIILEANEDQRPVLAYAIDNSGFIWSNHPNKSDVNAAKFAVGMGSPKSVTSWTEVQAGNNADFCLGMLQYVLDQADHSITFNDHCAIQNTGTQKWELKGKKTIKCVRTTSNNPGFWFNSASGYSELIHINQGANITFSGGAVLDTNSQYGTSEPYIPRANENNDGRRPAIRNSGTLTLTDVACLRAGSQASYVLKNEGTATLTGGGSLQGGARSGSTSSLVDNSGNLTVSHFGLDASSRQSNAALRPYCAIKNSGTCTISGSNYCAIGCSHYGIYNTGTIKDIRGSGSGIPNIHGSQMGIYNSGTIEKFTNMNVTYNGQGVENSGTITYSGGNVTYNTEYGIKNSGKITHSGGYISNNYNDGVKNSKTYDLSGGNIHSNQGYGINNTGTVNHSGGSIYHNAGGRVVSGTGEDTTDAGVYQNGTYNISGTAKVYDNAIYLVSGSKKVNQNGAFNGSAILTTGQNDRTLGRELVTNSKSTDSSKYTLAYGNYGGKIRAKYVKNDDGRTDFTGSEVGVHYGGNIKKAGITSTSQYLSGIYAITYNMNKPAGCSPSPTSYSPTTFWWRETVTPLFGSNWPTDRNNNFEFDGWKDTVTGTIYKTNRTFNTASTVLNDNRVYDGQWLPLDRYTIYYDKNDGVYYDTIATQQYDRDVYYDKHFTGWGNETGSATYDYKGGTGTVDDPTRTYDALYYNRVADSILWNKSSNGSGTSYGVYERFINLAPKNGHITLYQQWNRNSIILPNAQKEGYVLDGWQINGTGTVYKPGTVYTPTANLANVNFVAKWVLNAYDVNYTYNDRNNKTASDFCERDKTYTYRDDAPSPEYANMFFDYDGHDSHGAKITNSAITSTGASSLPVECTFSHWRADSSPYEREAGDSFINIAPAGGQVNLSGEWDRRSITLPSGERERYILDHWEVIIEGKMEYINMI